MALVGHWERHRSQRVHSSWFSSTTPATESSQRKMSTGQNSVQARQGWPRRQSSGSTLSSMNTPGLHPLLHQGRDLGELLGHHNPGISQEPGFGPGGVLGAFHYGAGMPKTNSRQVVGELPADEGHDGEPG